VLLSGRDIATWGEYARTNPANAKLVADVFRSHPHHVVATIRSDGSPRLGGTSVFVTEEDLWIGTKSNSFRTKDLLRDSRCALYSAPIDEHLVRPDIQIDGVAQRADEEKTRELLSAVGEPEDAAVFLLQIRALRILTVDRDELVIESWSPATGTKIRRISAEVEA
jgi:hypothetical protein